MNDKIYKNRKKILTVATLITIAGVVLSFLKWGVEPEETIAGFLCGLGVFTIIFSLGIKNSNQKS